MMASNVPIWGEGLVVKVKVIKLSLTVTKLYELYKESPQSPFFAETKKIEITMKYIKGMLKIQHYVLQDYQYRDAIFINILILQCIFQHKNQIYQTIS